MVAHFLVRYFFANQRVKNGRLFQHQLYARDLLTSAVEDVDVLLDWWYWYDTCILNKKPNVAEWFFQLQLTFTILGTITWALVASDGHLIHITSWTLSKLLKPILWIMGSSFFCCCCSKFQSKRAIKRVDNMLLDQQASAGSMLLLGIVLEDIPQTIITFFIEQTDDDGVLSLTGLAAANFLSSLYNALIKLAEAYDLRHDVLVPSGPLLSYKAHSESISCLTSINGNKFLSSSFDNTIKLWKLSRSGECIKQFDGHYHSISSVAAIPETTLFVSGSHDYLVKVWDWQAGKCIKTLQGHAFDVNAVATLNEEKVLAGYYDNSIKLWNVAEGTCEQTFKGHTGEVQCLASIGNDRLVSGSSDSSIKLWNLYQSDAIVTFPGHLDAAVTCLVALNENSFLSGSTDKTIKMWFVFSTMCARTFEMHHSSAITCLAVAHDGSSFLSGSMDKTVNLWSTTTGTCLHTFHGHASSVEALCVLRNGRFASGSRDGTIILWHIGSGVENEEQGGDGDDGANSDYVLSQA